MSRIGPLVARFKFHGSSVTIAAVVSGLLHALLAIAWAIESPDGASGPDVATAIRRHLDAGEFSVALQRIRQLPPSQQDGWLAELARRQANGGAYYGAWQTLSSMQDGRGRRSAMDAIRKPAPPGSRGGVTEDDFQPLIDLITATIAPDSWDINGGKGAIMPFVAGVYVDSAGVLRRVSTSHGPTLEGLRRRAAIPLEHRQVSRPSRLRKVSLSRLERAVQLRWARGEPPDEVMRHLAGIYRIQYVFIYPETGDVVIAGPAGGWHAGPAGIAVSDVSQTPVVLLDDLVVLLRQARQSMRPFGCSINPRQERLAEAQQFLEESSRRALRPGERNRWLEELRQLVGQQDIEVFGIEPTSHAARVLVEADYRMKLVGIGLEESVLGVPSYLDIVAAQGGVGQMTILRWWFAMNYDAVRANEDRTAFALDGPAVRVMSENEMLAERGQRVATGRSDEASSRFASAFTAHFDALAQKYPVYGELRNVFDLALVARLLEVERLVDRGGWYVSHFDDPQAYQVAQDVVPRTVESVSNARVIDGRKIVAVVSGGVWADPAQWVSQKAIRRDSGEELLRAYTYGAPQDKQLSDDRWWWD